MNACVFDILENQVGEETGEWLDTFALVTECTDAKFCNTTSQVQEEQVPHRYNCTSTSQVQEHRYLLSAGTLFICLQSYCCHIR